MSKTKTYVANISDFQPDPKNANKHTLRGRNTVDRSMRQRGYARPAFAANDNVVLGGNLSTLDVATDIGLGDGKVLVIETDGRMPIIHKRMDIASDSEEARLLAIEDNRAGELSLDWNVEQLLADYESGLPIADLWNDAEFAALLEGAADGLLAGNGVNDPMAEWKGMPEFENHPQAYRTIYIHFKTKQDVDEFFKIINQKNNEGIKYIWYPEREASERLLFTDES